MPSKIIWVRILIRDPLVDIILVGISVHQSLFRGSPLKFIVRSTNSGIPVERAASSNRGAWDR